MEQTSKLWSSSLGWISLHSSSYSRWSWSRYHSKWIHLSLWWRDHCRIVLTHWAIQILLLMLLNLIHSLSLLVCVNIWERIVLLNLGLIYLRLLLLSRWSINWWGKSLRHSRSNPWRNSKSWGLRLNLRRSKGLFYGLYIRLWVILVVLEYLLSFSFDQICILTKTCV